MLRKPEGLRWKVPLFCLCAAVLLFWVICDLPCPVRQLTGLICPGCGMGRAWLAFLRLDPGAAFFYHPMFWAVPVVGVFVLYDCRLFRRDRLNKLILGLLGGAVLLCYALRLVAFLSGSLAI